MYLPLGTFTPDVKLGLVSASRNCFPRSLSEQRTKRLAAQCGKMGLELFRPQGEAGIIETKAHARDAARQVKEAGCDAVVLYLGNFSPEIEDAYFTKMVPVPVAIMAAAEESPKSLAQDRGDALCGLLSACLAIKRRGAGQRLHIPQDPVVDAKEGAKAIQRFERIMRIVKGIKSCTIGLFGPRPRDFETCNYNLASLAGIGVEVEELGFFDLVNQVRKESEGDLAPLIEAMKAETSGIPSGDFARRLAAYEKAVLHFKDELRLSGMTSQCWSEQEEVLGHVPCFINARMAGQGFPIACENDAYSLIAELMGQYASNGSVAILDINHSIPAELAPGLGGDPKDLVGLFHCGNTDPKRMKEPAMKYQLIMHRLMEPDKEPDITRGTLEGQIQASPITVLQVQGEGDAMQAYLIEGEFLDLDPNTFGSTGTAHLPGFRRFYRHALLGRFHHHAAVAFDHCGALLYDALKLLGVRTIHTPVALGPVYQGENPFLV
jgi:L-fucose isomerase-like protein